jgi:hypothetical protein
VGQREAVQLVAVKPPLGQKCIHQGDEAIVVAAFQKMHHFVNDDVLQAARGFFDEFQV